MPQMNKRPEEVPRKKQLEDDLLGTVAAKQVQVEQGRFKSTHNKFAQQARERNRMFNIKQGKRRRHPETVLAQFKTIVDGTENVSSAWEEALQHEQKRVEVPQEYNVKESGFVANQVGLVTTALDNFYASKAKMSRVVPVGF